MCLFYSMGKTTLLKFPQHLLVQMKYDGKSQREYVHALGERMHVGFHSAVNVK